MNLTYTTIQINQDQTNYLNIYIILSGTGVITKSLNEKINPKARWFSAELNQAFKKLTLVFFKLFRKIGTEEILSIFEATVTIIP